MTGEPKTVQERKPRIPDNNSFTNISFPGGSAGKESTCNVGDLGSVPGLGRFPGEGKCHPLQYFGLENSMGCIEFHGVTKSQTQLKDFHFQASYYPLSHVS